MKIFKEQRMAFAQPVEMHQLIDCQIWESKLAPSDDMHDLNHAINSRIGAGWRLGWIQLIELGRYLLVFQKNEYNPVP